MRCQRSPSNSFLSTCLETLGLRNAATCFIICLGRASMLCTSSKTKFLLLMGFFPSKPKRNLARSELLVLECKIATTRRAPRVWHTVHPGGIERSVSLPSCVTRGCACTFYVDVMLLRLQEICKDEVLHGNPPQTYT